MRKNLILGVMILAALAPLSTANAAGMDGKAIEQIVVDLENVIGRIEGVDFAALTVREHGNGVYSVTIPIPEATRERLLAESATEASSATFKVMAVGLQLTNPSSLSALITAVDAIDDVLYNFWWATANLTSNTRFSKTTFQLKGPGDKFKIVDIFEYPDSAFQLYWTEQNSGNFGFHTILSKVAGGGKAKTIYLAN